LNDSSAFFIHMTWFIDAHEDIAWNIVTFQRDYTRSAFETRQLEASTSVPAFNGDTMLGWPEYNQANVRLVFGTLFASPARPGAQEPANAPFYHNLLEANHLYWNQLGIYHQLCENHPQAFRLVLSRQQLQAHLQEWEQPGGEQKAQPVGLVPLMEGAEGILSCDELSRWWEAGLRIIGLAWSGNRFTGGTHAPGPLTAEGKDLLAAMAEIGFILDLAHMDRLAAFQALERYPGRIITSHANASRLVEHYQGNRLLDDDLIQAMLERDVVIGVVPYNNFLKFGWKDSGGRAQISLRMVAEQADYICQLAGDAEHVGIGTDFDGGFGLQSTPIELNSIADLPKLLPYLVEMGYTVEQCDSIASGNFLRVLESALP
jgi:membrane dipeptidase